MSISFHIDRKTNTIFTRAVGSVSIDDLIQNSEAILLHPDFKRNQNSLVDLSEARPAENIDFSRVNEFQSYIESVQEIRGNCKWAIVAPDDLVFGLARMFAIISQDLSIRTRIFRSEEEAREWLGI